jgi:ferredoxin--NADP+ reductase
VFTNEGGKVKDGLYVVGWAKRGPSGTIPTNRTEALQVAQRISQEIIGLERPGGAALRELLEQRHVHWLDYAAWRRLDAAELARASEGRCREKFTTVAGMLEAAQAHQSLTCPSAKG